MQGRAQGHLGPPARPPSPGTAGVLGCLPDTSPSDLQFPVTHHTPVQSTGVSETVANAWTPAPRPRPDSPPHAGFGARVGDAKRKRVVHPEESRRPGGVACHSEAEALTGTRALRQGAPAGPPRAASCRRLPPSLGVPGDVWLFVKGGQGAGWDEIGR